MKRRGDYKGLVGGERVSGGRVLMEVSMREGRSEEYVVGEDVEVKEG